MDSKREIELMTETIKLAKMCQPEDGRIHPKVAAILADKEGNVLYSAFRGEEIKGGHAEFHILRKAKKDGTNLAETTLFVTLEPCTRRGENKIPCAVRVAESGIKKLIIGTLDPNPQITGSGEMYLSYQMEVERYPGYLARELFDLNKEFFEQHRNNQIPSVSLYAGSSSSTTSSFRPALAGKREGILQQSMDLMMGTSEEIFIFAGDLSWLRELQLSIFLAKDSGRTVKILCDQANTRGKEFLQLVEIARHLGAEVGLLNSSVFVRGTLVSTKSDQAAFMCVEKKPDVHPILFLAPHEANLINAIADWADRLWNEAERKVAFETKVNELNSLEIADALKQGIPQYRNANVEVCSLDVYSLKPLTTTLERFKLFRLRQINLLQRKFKLQNAQIVGSPWPIIPPIIEKLNGEYIIIDGTHRVYSAIQSGLQNIEVILVTGASEVLPASPLSSWDKVNLISGKLPRERRYEKYNESAFRPIRSVIESLMDIKH